MSDSEITSREVVFSNSYYSPPPPSYDWAMHNSISLGSVLPAHSLDVEVSVLPPYSLDVEVSVL